jgi:hypothetical protein
LTVAVISRGEQGSTVEAPFHVIDGDMSTDGMSMIADKLWDTEIPFLDFKLPFINTVEPGTKVGDTSKTTMMVLYDTQEHDAPCPKS